MCVTNYTSADITTLVTSTIGSVFAGLNDNMSMIIVLVIGMFALSAVAVILAKVKGLGR